MPSSATYTCTQSPGAASASPLYWLYSSVSGMCSQSRSRRISAWSHLSMLNRLLAISLILVMTSASVSSTSVPSLFFSFWPTLRPVFSGSGLMNGTVRTVSMYFSGRSNVLPSSFCAIGYTRVTRLVTLPSQFTLFRFAPYRMT